MASSNPSATAALLPVAREAFAFLCELAESGNVAVYGLEQSQERINTLLHHVLQESLNILRHEDETVSLEQLGGIAAVRRLVDLQHAARALPADLRPDLERTLSQKVHQGARGRAARIAPRRKEDT